MKPISFTCETTVALAPEEIARRLLDVSRWPDFQGCWPVPGIQAAEFEIRESGVVGSRIRVTNRDGSTHFEDIVEWEPTHRLRTRMRGFPSPLSHLVTSFDETWEFQETPAGTVVKRTFQLHPKSTLAKLPLRWVASFLKRAVAQHLGKLQQSAVAAQKPLGNEAAVE